MERKQQTDSGMQIFWQKTGKVFSVIRRVLQFVFTWLYRLRGVLLAIPVGMLAASEAMKNMERLPETVGLILLESGEYQYMVAREVAVMGPLAVTAVCLLLMFCSRKVLYPWLISLLTLVLPTVIWITNIFPA